jgi:hypothetical protein
MVRDRHRSDQTEPDVARRHQRRNVEGGSRFARALLARGTAALALVKSAARRMLRGAGPAQSPQERRKPDADRHDSSERTTRSASDRSASRNGRLSIRGERVRESRAKFRSSGSVSAPSGNLTTGPALIWEIRDALSGILYGSFRLRLRGRRKSRTPLPWSLWHDRCSHQAAVGSRWTPWEIRTRRPELRRAATVREGASAPGLALDR